LPLVPLWVAYGAVFAKSTLQFRKAMFVATYVSHGCDMGIDLDGFYLLKKLVCEPDAACTFLGKSRKTA
jgi:energy-converting hydrogenase Eha subunit B